MSPKVMISNAMAGGLAAFINITVAISIAALMFAGAKTEYFVTGVTVLLVGTVVTGLGGTLASGFPGIVVAPRSALAPVFAGLVAAIVARLSNADPSTVLPTIVMTIMATTALAGLFLVILGQLGLGSLVRYLPYPVMGGFFAGIGFIFVKGGVSVATGQSAALDNLPVFLTRDVQMLALPGVAFAIGFYWLRQRFDHWTVFPLFLAASISVFYAVLGLQHWTLVEAASAGWLPIVEATATRLPVFDFADIGLVQWNAVAEQAGSMAVVAILCAIILLLDVSGIEIITRRDLSPNHELKVAGLTNLLNGVAGGYPGVHVASDTALTYKLGGDRRLMGFVYGATVALAIFAGASFVGAIPTFILGGLLIYVGIDFLVDWGWRTRKDMPLSDYLVILAILAIVAGVGILEGVAFGFAVTAVLFVVNYSRLSVIRSELGGHEHASNVDRDLGVREFLNREGKRILILRLQGFIFFGTSDKLIAAIKNRLLEPDRSRKIEYLVLDLHHVSQLDTSAVKAFAKLAQLADREGLHITMTDLDANTRNHLEGISFFVDAPGVARRLGFDNLDDGVAWCEEQLLAQFEVTGMEENMTFEDRLAQILGADVAPEITRYFCHEEVIVGAELFRLGDKGDHLYLVHSGAAAVVIPLPGGKNRVVRVFKAGAVVGEMALYTGAPRSANVRVVESGVMFRLDRNGMRGMQMDHPDAAGQFHAFVVRLLAERLDRANRELRRSL